VTPGAVLVVAKAPVPGLAKTRLAATIGAEAAADVAAAALLDTLEAATASGAGTLVALTGDVGGDLRPDGGGQPGLGPSRHRRLGDHQHRAGRHDSTRAKSRIARSVPRTLPETLERVPAARGPYGTSTSTRVQPAAPALTSSSSG